jgi:hypothetical protein
MNRRLGLVALAASISIASPTAAPAAALAADVSSGELQTLASEAAGGDQQALAELRTVTSVGGRPVTIAAALATNRGDELHARLLALTAAGAGTTPAISAANARRAAQAILHGQSSGRSTVSDPLQSALNKIGHALATLARDVPGGSVVFWTVVAALVLGVATLGSRRMLGRLERAGQRRADGFQTAVDDPEELEREARAAEARGEFDAAVRLRFRAGLLSLGARKAITYRPSLLTADVARRLHSTRFEALAATFERVAYGGAAAGSADAAEAREGWKLVLGEVGQRS